MPLFSSISEIDDFLDAPLTKTPRRFNSVDEIDAFLDEPLADTATAVAEPQPDTLAPLPASGTPLIPFQQPEQEPYDFISQQEPSGEVRPPMPEPLQEIIQPERSDVPSFRQAPEPTFTEKLVEGFKSIVSPTSRARETAEAQIALEAKERGLTKEQYIDLINPENANLRKVERFNKQIGGGVMGTVEGMAGSLDWLTEGKIGRDLANQAKLWREELTPEDPGFSGQLASGIGSMGTFFIPGMGIAKGAQSLAKISARLARWTGSSAAAGMEAATEAGHVYRNVFSDTNDIEAAEKAATKTFWLNIPLLVVTNKLGVFAEKGGRLKRGAIASQMEGGQEAGQEKISGSAEGKDVTLGEYLTSYGVGAITGGGLSLAMGGTEDVAVPPKQPKPTPKPPIQKPTLKASIAESQSKEVIDKLNKIKELAKKAQKEEGGKTAVEAAEELIKDVQEGKVSPEESEAFDQGLDELLAEFKEGRRQELEGTEAETTKTKADLPKPDIELEITAPKPGKEVAQDAERIRKDERQFQETGDAGERGEVKGRQDLEREAPEQPRYQKEAQLKSEAKFRPKKPLFGVSSRAGMAQKRARTVFNPEKHTLIQFVRQLGGISTKKNKLAPEIRNLFSIRESGGNLVNNKTGLGLDTLKELVAEEGFNTADMTESDFLDLLEQDKQHKNVYSNKRQNYDVPEYPKIADMPKKEISEAELEVGDRVFLEGDPHKVIKKTADETVLKDGTTIKLKPNEDIEVDAGYIEKVEDQQLVAREEGERFERGDSEALQAIPYSKELKITNIENISKGTGARYLEVIKGEGDSYIAKQWRRKPIQKGIVVDFEPETQPEAGEQQPTQTSIPVPDEGKPAGLAEDRAKAFEKEFAQKRKAQVPQRDSGPMFEELEKGGDLFAREPGEYYSTGDLFTKPELQEAYKKAENRLKEFTTAQLKERVKKAARQNYDAPYIQLYKEELRKRGIQLTGLLAKEESAQYALTSPIFYSKLLKHLEAKLPNRMHSLQARRLISAWVRKGEIKQAEVDWSGLSEWVADRKGTITKAEILQFLSLPITPAMKESVLTQGQALFEQHELFNRQGGLFDAETETIQDRTGQSPDTGRKTAGGVQSRQGEEEKPGDARTIANGIAEEINEQKTVMLKGRTIRNADDMADAAQIFRNPRYETFRIIGIKNNRVVTTDAVTSRIPNTVIIPKEFLNEVKDSIKNMDVDGYYLIHNHPSGHVDISHNDRKLTYKIAKEISGFKGHIIIDTETYGLMKIYEKTVYDDFSIEKLIRVSDINPLEPSKPHKLLGVRVYQENILANIASALKNPIGFVSVVHLDIKLKIRGIDEIPVNWFNQRAIPYIAKRQQKLGVTNSVVIANNIHKEALEDKFIAMAGKGLLLDAMFEGEQTLGQRNIIDTSTMKQPEWIESRFKVAERVAEEGEKFEREGGPEKKRAAKIKALDKQLKAEGVRGTKNLMQWFKNKGMAYPDAERLTILINKERFNAKEERRLETEQKKEERLEILKKELKSAKYARRVDKINAIKDFFKLNEADLKNIKGIRDPRNLNDKEFETLLQQMASAAYLIAERRDAVIQIQATISHKELKKTNNLRKALKLPPINVNKKTQETTTKMTLAQLKEFDEILNQFQTKDEFLTVRELETIDKTELKGIRTFREAAERLSKETGLSVEELSKIEIKTLDSYRSDTALAERHPLFRIMVERTNRVTLDARAKFLTTEKKVNELIKAARKSRKRSLLEKAIPQDQFIFEYLESKDKESVAKDMTTEELEAANFIQQEYVKIRDYLVQTEVLKKFRENYITHIRQSFMEAVKTNGPKGAVKNLLEHYKQDQAYFKILDEATGEILPFEKFFKFSLKRTGQLTPTQNVAKAFTVYLETFEKKKALDKLIPALAIYTRLLTPDKKTPRGLDVDRTLKNFVYTWINNKKGRQIEIAKIKQGDNWDMVLRGIKMLTVVHDLGANIAVGVAAQGGEQITNYTMLGTRNYAKGIQRMTTKRGKEIIEKYRNFVGKNPWTEMAEASKDIGNSLYEGLFVLFRDATTRANKGFLLGSLTDAEWNSGELSTERLANLKIEMGRYRVVENAKSIVGSTTVGGIGTQYKTWAIAIARGTISNVKTLIKTKELRSREAQELIRSVVATTAVALFFSAMADFYDEDDKSFAGKMYRTVKRDLFSIMGALDPRVYLGWPRVPKFVYDLSNALVQFVTLQEYKKDTRYNEKGDLKGLATLGRTLKPVGVTQFRPFYQKKKTKRRDERRLVGR